MKSRGRFLLFTIFLIIVSIPAEGLSQGKVNIKPTISASWRMDDNFYRSETNEKEVYTYLLSPGIELGYETAKSLVSLSYNLNAYYYDDQDPLVPGALPADNQDYVGHGGNFIAKTRPTDRILLGLEESYYKTRDPAASDIFSEPTDREKYYINRLTPSIFYDFGAKFSAGIRYRDTRTNYYAATREDSTEKRPMFDLVYNFNEKTSLDLEYQHWTRDYNGGTSDYVSNQGKLIFRKQYHYFGLEAGGGYHKREFEDPTLKDINIFTYRFGLMGQNPPALEGMPRSYLSFVAERNVNNQGSGDTYFKDNSFTLMFGYVYMEKVPLDIMVNYQTRGYKMTYGLTSSGTTALRDDDIYKMEGGIGYILKEWLILRVTAGYEKRDSNIVGRNYKNNYYIARLDFNYSLGKR
jgi:hypothetical protein